MVLDPLNDGKSSIALVDTMGDDLAVVNAARVSFNSRSDWDVEPCECGEIKSHFGYPCTLGACNHRKVLKKADAGLIGFLARGCPKSELDDLALELAIEDEEKIIRERLMEFRRMAVHWTPFSQVQLKFRIKAPFFIARQWFKHQVGVTRNEISRRYVKTAPEFFIPEEWRLQADNVKQGSSDEIHGLSTTIYHMVDELFDHIADMYTHLMDIENVCPEQARILLPMATYTEWVETGSLAAYARVFNQRSDSHAQQEINAFADALGQLMPEDMAVSWRALTDG